jgi:hypothetical protein
MTIRELIERLEDVEDKELEIEFIDMNNFTNKQFVLVGKIPDEQIFQIYVELGY